MDTSETVFQMLDLTRGDHNFPGVTARPVIHKVEGEKQQRPQNQKMNKRFP
jgi:hypothetical protein